MESGPILKVDSIEFSGELDMDGRERGESRNLPEYPPKSPLEISDPPRCPTPLLSPYFPSVYSPGLGHLLLFLNLYSIIPSQLFLLSLPHLVSPKPLAAS